MMERDGIALDGAAILSITDDGMAARGKLAANLVITPCVQINFNK